MVSAISMGHWYESATSAKEAPRSEPLDLTSRFLKYIENRNLQGAAPDEQVRAFEKFARQCRSWRENPHFSFAIKRLEPVAREVKAHWDTQREIEVKSRFLIESIRRFQANLLAGKTMITGRFQDFDRLRMKEIDRLVKKSIALSRSIARAAAVRIEHAATIMERPVRVPYTPFMSIVKSRMPRNPLELIWDPRVVAGMVAAASVIICLTDPEGIKEGYHHIEEMLIGMGKGDRSQWLGFFEIMTDNYDSLAPILPPAYRSGPLRSVLQYYLDEKIKPAVLNTEVDAVLSVYHFLAG